MRRPCRALALLSAALLLLTAAGCGADDPAPGRGSERSGGPLTAREPPGGPNAAARGERGSLEERGYVVSVHRVVDGDTLEVRGPMGGLADVRLIGVDSPETGGPRGAQPYGDDARDFARFALEGEKVALESDLEKRDRYGRLLAYVWLPGGEMFNETLLREGYAQVATFPPNTRYLDRFLAAQREAREAGRGLWGLPEERLCDLTDRGNGIGEGSPGCGEALAPGGLYAIFTVL